MNLLEIKEKLVPFIKAAGDRALSEWDNIQINIHEDQVDVTSEIEKQIEKDFADFVLENFSEYGFQGEELPELNREGEYKFLIDPIDGSKYYAKGVSFWTVTIALVKGEQPLLGLIYMPTTNQLFWAGKDLGAYLNEKKLSLTEETDLSKLQICVDLSVKSEIYSRNKQKLTPILEGILSSAYRTRMIGSGSLALCWLAQGLFGGYFYIFPKDNEKKEFLDIAAGVILAEEAGAEMYKHEISLEDDFLVRIIARKEVIEKIKEITS